MAEVIERGDLYFLYRPKVRPAGEQTTVHGGDEVQRLFMVMHPEGRRLFRLTVLGRKHLPEIGGRERLWGFVDRVAQRAEALREEFREERYTTKTRGTRMRPAARAAGEGSYSLVRHDGHIHFAYVLELPKEPGEVQRAFNIEPEGSYIISVKNPQQGAPRGAGLPEQEKATLPQAQQRRFRGRRFIDPDPPVLLDHTGAEFILVGAEEHPEQELEVDLQAEDENEASAEIFRDLRLHRSDVPLEPLFTGEWR